MSNIEFIATAFDQLWAFFSDIVISPPSSPTPTPLLFFLRVRD